MNRAQSNSGIAILIALVLLMLHAGSGASFGQDNAKASDSSLVKGMRFSVELTGSKRFKPHGVILVKLRLKNTSRSRIYIFKHLGFGPGGFRVTILDSNNWGVRPNLIRESFPPPIGSKDDFQAIEPGKSFEEEFTIPLDFYEIVPGNYSLIVSFLSPVPALSDVPSGLKVLTSDDYFEAKPIGFKVLAP